MQKLSVVRFAQAVTIGGKTETYIDAAKGYDMWLIDEFRIKITNKNGKEVWSSLFNCTQWEFDARPPRKRVPRKPGQDFEDQELPLPSEAPN